MLFVLVLAWEEERERVKGSVGEKELFFFSNVLFFTSHLHLVSFHHTDVLPRILSISHLTLSLSPFSVEEDTQDEIKIISKKNSFFSLFASLSSLSRPPLSFSLLFSLSLLPPSSLFSHQPLSLSPSVSSLPHAHPEGSVHVDSVHEPALRRVRRGHARDVKAADLREDRRVPGHQRGRPPDDAASAGHGVAEGRGELLGVLLVAPVAFLFFNF